MSDLIERLRGRADNGRDMHPVDAEIDYNAADEIERLEADVRLWQQNCVNANAEIERLHTLRKEDGEDMQRLSDQVDYLSDENAKLQALIPPSRPVVICADCKSLEAALTRIATMPPVNEEFGYQGYDADRMSAIARDALEG